MGAEEVVGVVRDDETEAEYIERKTMEYLARRERSIFRPHFNYRRSR